MKLRQLLPRPPVSTDWQNTPQDISELTGFVYIITNNINKRFYIGQKTFWKKLTLPPLKGKIFKRHKVVESDWKSYYGSSVELSEDVKKYGKENFTREILYLLKSKALINYIETKLQFEYEVLFDEKAYNKIINCRINQNQIPK